MGEIGRFQQSGLRLRQELTGVSGDHGVPSGSPLIYKNRKGGVKGGGGIKGALKGACKGIILGPSSSSKSGLTTG